MQSCQDLSWAGRQNGIWLFQKGAVEPVLLLLREMQGWRTMKKGQQQGRNSQIKKTLKTIPKVKLLPLGGRQKWKAGVVPVTGPSTTSSEAASDHPHWPLTLYPHWL